MIDPAVPVSPDLEWCADGCGDCDVDQLLAGSAAVLPVAASIDGEDVVLAYRCREGHDWTASMPLTGALETARSFRVELASSPTAPYWPPRPIPRAVAAHDAAERADEPADRA